MTRLISFSLWGSDPKYCVGAVRNARLAPKIYPDWKARFYVASSVPDRYVKQLEDNGAQIICLSEQGSWHGMFWRFLPASDPSVEVFISRDCDSRLGFREATAVQHWLQSPYKVHSMADHPYHFHPAHGLMGGMFGMKYGACTDIKRLIDAFVNTYKDAWQCDQDFLRDHVFPLVGDNIYAHSDLHRNCRRFTYPRGEDGIQFVGQVFDENDNTVEDHIAALNQVIQR